MAIIVPKAQIYLAGPFFKPEQIEAQEAVEKLCDELGHPYFSPRHHIVLAPDATKEQRQIVFKINVRYVRSARLVLANIEGNDTGTLYEIGAAYGFTPTVLWSPNPERKLNVMLAEGVQGYAPGFEALKRFLTGNDRKEISGNSVRTFNSKELQQWNGDIF